MAWNLWLWAEKRWIVLGAYDEQHHAEETAKSCRSVGEDCTVARQGTPKDEYMRDNATVRHAPQNYLRIRQVENWADEVEKVADHRARGSFDT